MDAQDVLQDAYVQAFTKLNTLQDYQDNSHVAVEKCKGKS